MPRVVRKQGQPSFVGVSLFRTGATAAVSWDDQFGEFDSTDNSLTIVPGFLCMIGLREVFVLGDGRVNADNCSSRNCQAPPAPLVGRRLVLLCHVAADRGDCGLRICAAG